MGISRKDTLSYKISVEGVNCETIYFEHLSKLINSIGKDSVKMVNFDIKKKNPYSFVKNKLPIQVGKAKHTFIHIQDIEDYNDEFQLKKFRELLDELEKAKKDFRMSSYLLGYSNYTFELWILLHKKKCGNHLSNRTQYLKMINETFGTNFKDLDEFKKEDNFKKIVNEFSIDDVKNAILNAELLRNSNEQNGNKKIQYKKFEFFADNPDTTVDIVVKKIFEDCKIFDKKREKYNI